MLVTVVIPTYKRTAYLKVALESVIRQTYSHFECLVVNDSPPFREKVDEVVASIGDERIRVIHNPQNGGESFSRNNAIRAAKGEIIALLDDDDYWKPGFLQQHVTKHEANPDLGIVYCGYVKFWDDELLGTREYFADQTPPRDMYQAMLSGKFVLASSSIVSIRRSCFEDCGTFDSALPSFADWDMWVRIAQKYPFGNIPESLTYYRHHLGERGSTDIEKRLTGIEVITKKWESEKGFEAFGRKLMIRAFFNEIRNEVLRGNRLNSIKLLRECISRCKSEIIPNYKVFLKAITIIILGKGYMAGHKAKYS